MDGDECVYRFFGGQNISNAVAVERILVQKWTKKTVADFDVVGGLFQSSAAPNSRTLFIVGGIAQCGQLSELYLF